MSDFFNSLASRVRAGTAALSHSQSDNSFLVATVKKNTPIFLRGNEENWKMTFDISVKTRRHFPAAE
jgi:hypothetical protein